MSRESIVSSSPAGDDMSRAQTSFFTKSKPTSTAEPKINLHLTLPFVLKSEPPPNR